MRQRQFVADLVSGTQVPRMFRVRQVFPRPRIDPRDIPGIIDGLLSQEKFASRVRPGMHIAITAGSRGVANVALTTKCIADFCKKQGAKPFVVPAMGSHGGATAEGQREILAGYGIVEEYVGCPIVSSMEVVKIGVNEEGVDVYIDRHAAEADGIILGCRIKPHTAFRGPYESGLMKMMAIGLGKQQGAEDIHGQSPAIMHELIEEYGRTILKNAPILGGVAVLENAYDKICKIQGLTPQEIIDLEPGLRDESYTTIARLLFDRCDVLVVDKIGKNISGDGMDPNVTGRFCTQYASGGIQAEKVVVLDLTDETHGNAQGVGLADVTTRRLYNKLSMEMTYPTGVTNTFLHLMKIPMVMDNDREAMQLALRSCPEAEDRDHLKLIRIPDTAHIAYIEISEGLIPAARENPRLEILSEPYDLAFDDQGNLF